MSNAPVGQSGQRAKLGESQKDEESTFVQSYGSQCSLVTDPSGV